MIESLLFVFLITLGGILITLSVHLIPVGGAPAAMAQAPGVGTGTTQLAFGIGLTGLLVTISVYTLSDNTLLGIVFGGIASTVMIAIVMLISNVSYIYGIGIPLASGKAVKDPITKDRQDIYISKGTEGHGVPTAAFLSGIIGGFVGGIGGSLIYAVLYMALSSEINAPLAAVVSLPMILAISIYIINAVIASYNIGGTIEGFYDPKIKKVYKAVLVSAIVTFLCGVLSLIIILKSGGVV
ncbi:MAG: tetrahydromethanopterin S-methyltransferase subunit D [Methanimicrococcus sp.]|nr:tetrahydromethanopterin S-methyltransferase subunit D [Methanimicrococcus sp.]